MRYTCTTDISVVCICIANSIKLCHLLWTTLSFASFSSPPYPSSYFKVDGEARTLADGALCANNPSQVALLEIAELAACATVNSQSTFGGGGGGGGGGEAATREARRVPSVALVLSLGCGQPAAAASHAMTSTSSPSQWFGGVAASIASAQGEV